MEKFISLPNADRPLETERLYLTPLDTNDTDFIYALLNSEGWIKYIGNRSILTSEDALNYIIRILGNQSVKYWVVRLKSSNTPAGIITFIKRLYLGCHDIGFAFLPEFHGNGYAYEAVQCIFSGVIKNSGHTHIMASTLPENSSSIRLLEKLGLVKEEELEVEKETLIIYKIAVEKL